MRSRRAYLLALTLTVGLLLAFAGVASATALDTLKQPPFTPTDVSLFNPEVYSEAPPMVPAGPTANDEATLRNHLKALLAKRFGSGSSQVKQGLAKFDAASTKAIVPHPRLRAALVALKGTVGQPAINGALDGTYASIEFGPLPDGFGAQVQAPRPGETKPRIVFNDKYQYEDIRLIAPVHAHEVLHRDPTVSDKEELIAAAIHFLVNGQFLLETSSLATSGTQRARVNNTQLMARLNSRDANGKLRLFTSTGSEGIFPGGNFVPYFAAPYEPLGNSTPGSAVLKQMVRNVVGSGVSLPSTVNFDDNTLLLLDSRQKVFTNAELVRLATILKLDTSPQAAQRALEAERRASDRPVPSYERIFGAK